jgi:hypothetical protein
MPVAAWVTYTTTPPVAYYGLSGYGYTSSAPFLQAL